MSRIVYIYVNGINSWPGTADGWTDRAVTWTHTRTEHCAEKFEYWSGPFTRRMRQQWRAEKLAKMMSFYRARNIIIRLVGHSNGCDVIIRAMKLVGYKVDELHLIAPACSENMTENRLPYYLASGKVRQLTLYMAGNDRALRLAYLTEPLLGLFGMGYGWLGYVSPDQLEATFGTAARIVYEPHYGHSSWFDEHLFDRTMRIITGKEPHEKVYADIVGIAGLCPVVG